MTETFAQNTRPYTRGPERVACEWRRSWNRIPGRPRGFAWRFTRSLHRFDRRSGRMGEPSTSENTRPLSRHPEPIARRRAACARGGRAFSETLATANREHASRCDRGAECCVGGSCGLSNASPSFRRLVRGHVAKGRISCGRQQSTSGARARLNGWWGWQLLSCLCRPVVAVRAPRHRRGPRLPSRAQRRRVVRSSFRGPRHNSCSMGWCRHL